jgi:hypothetical protein
MKHTDHKLTVHMYSLTFALLSCEEGEGEMKR